MNEPILTTLGLSKNFGGLAAVRDVSLDFRAHGLHAIIGPNGAGKTTFINLLSGDLVPSEGRISFLGHDITRLRPHAVSRLGIGRSYQITNIFGQFTCQRNVQLAAQSRMTTNMRFFRPATAYGDVVVRADQALDRAGLAMRADDVAETISHGEQRQLEIAMLLATEPRVLLLDEPLAGMGAREASDVTRLISALAVDHCVVLIEHDMDVVFSIADQLTVMVNGSVLETGPPAQIRASETVREAYLGDTLPEAVG